MSSVYRFQPDVQLYDFAKLQQQLHAAQESRVVLLKKALGVIDQRLAQAFYDGADIRDLVYGRAWAMDQLLKAIWSLFEWPEGEIALLAVGGYGRGELHPKSDIDLLFLLKQDDDGPVRDQLTALITLLWDIKLDVGQSVRSLNDCEREARADLTVITNLSENRTLAGEDGLRQEMVQRLSTECMWPSAKFFKAKWQEQIARHHRFNNSEYHLEPNVKSSPGGLRDIQMIGWVAKRHFQADSLQDLLSSGFLTASEMRILEQGQCFLWQVRFALHLLAPRAEDRLLFDYQRQLAMLFGYLDTDKRLAVEQFMKRYYRVVTSLSELNDVLLQHFEQALLASSAPAEPPRVLNRRFQMAEQFIEARSPDVFEQQPFALIEIFLLMAQHPEIQGVRATTIRAIRDARYLVDEAFRRDLRARSLVMALLRSEGNVALQLRRMSRYGILGRYLPEFGHAVGLTQHDLFHIYTVDAHTLKLLKFLQVFRTPEAEQDYPLATRLIQHIPKLELLWIAGLYHDLGKGRGGDHSELGAEDVLRFAKQHQLSLRDQRLLVWLVEQHLLMSMTAQKQDLSDPDVILHFAEQVGSQMHLDYLYLLTVADLNATNPRLWNGWRAALLNQLYAETARTFRRGLENPIDPQEWIAETQQEAMALLINMGEEPEAVRALWSTLDEDYFLQDAPSEVAWHTQGILHHQRDEPLVLVAAPTQDMREGGTKVFIHAPDAAFGFAATATMMDRLGLSIHDARFCTSRQGYTLNTLIVLEQDGQVPRDPARLEEIRLEMVRALKDPEQFPALVQLHTPRQLKHFTLPTQVYISNDANQQRTLVEVVTPDRPGLLARIGRIFVEFDLLLQNAKIATLGERVEDVFFVTQRDGAPIADPDLCLRLQQRLCDELDRQAGR